MNRARGSLRGAVVVITGASSGIGREAAIQFAREGSCLVVAARRSEDLARTVELCEQAGGSAHSVVTDVTVEAEVEALRDATMALHGRIDVWVNNAGVTLFALLEQGAFEDHRRVIETNLFGSMLAARAVVPVFKAQQRGVLINVGSVLSKVGQPYVPSYVISKFAIRGMSEALRAELAELPDVHVCTLLPYAIDTPHFQGGANELGLHARAMPPVQSPEKVAHAIVELALHPQREVHVPRIAALGLVLHWLMPNTTERLLLRALTRWHFDDVPQPATEGNLYRPVETSEGHVHGKRDAQLSTPMFALWTVRELVRMQRDSLLRRLGARKPATPALQRT